ncbi:MFS transporter [Streptomyces sp. J2-1]|uniref:MFS transporter n=1 Tax=Streptomyces corallincola TaxID=2851888 RepID=UPI001C380B3B|nr:MFS transporter [Streptomyces corallincola]MBV2354349.1 MFS transporter [Streptomyces corallincola]
MPKTTTGGHPPGTNPTPYPHPDRDGAPAHPHPDPHRDRNPAHEQGGRARLPRTEAGSATAVPYRRLFSLPGTRAFTAGNLLARLPIGMFAVSAVVMIAGTRGSYALAGAVTATGLAATGVGGPWLARLVDRYGQARVAIPATLTAVLGSAALMLCVRAGAPDWTLFASYAATAATPNIGGLSRARWAHLLAGDPAALHTANSFEQAADELCFLLGPVLAAFLAGTFFPEAGTLVAAVLLLAGMLLFTARRGTEPPPTPATRGRSPLRSPGIPALLVCFTATGAVFGSMEVTTLAYADALGHRAAAGAVLALQAAGSCAAGLLFGARRPAGVRLPHCLLAMAALMALPWLAATATRSLTVLGAALLLAGTATAPTMVTAMTLVQRTTPADRLNEGMSLTVTALLTGIAAGSAVAGRLVEARSPATAFLLPTAAACAALLIALATRPDRHPCRDGSPDMTKAPSRLR